MIPVTKLLRAAFLVHGVYFVIYAVVFEFFVRPTSLLLGLDPPDTVVGWVATGVAAGEMMTVGVFLLLAAWQWRIQRFVLWVPIVQTSYNLCHDAWWLWRGYAPTLVTIDTVLIAGLMGVYVWTYKRTLDREMQRLRGERPGKKHFDARKLLG